MTAASIEERIRKPTGEVARIGACIYGRGGSGKTSLLASMPGPGIVIDIPSIEGGTMVLADHADRIDVLEVETFDEFEGVFDFLRIAAQQRRYLWAAIDSLTAAQVLAKHKALGDRRIDDDPMLLHLQDWGKIGELMASLIQRFRTIPMHMIFTAQERNRTTNNTSEIQPDLSPGSLSALLPSMFLVGRLYTQDAQNPDGSLGAERRLRVGPGEGYSTKVRAVPGRSLPGVVVQPNLAQIVGWLLGMDVPAPQGLHIEPNQFSLS